MFCCRHCFRRDARRMSIRAEDLRGMMALFVLWIHESRFFNGFLKFVEISFLL